MLCDGNKQLSETSSIDAIYLEIDIATGIGLGIEILLGLDSEYRLL